MKIKAFGLTFESDFEFKNLPQSQEVPDIFIHKVQHLSHLQLENATYYFLPKFCDFAIKNNTQIYVQENPSLSPLILQQFLLSVVIAALMQQRNAITMHANSLTKDGKTAILLMGKKRAGKSTLSAALCQNGYRLLADDLSPIQLTPGPVSIPSYPKLNLWQDAIDRLDLSDETMVRLGLPKKFQLYSPSIFFEKPLPVSAIYEINPDNHEVVQIDGVKKLPLLLANVFRYSFVKMRKEEKKLLGQLISFASTIPCFSGNREALLKELR